MHKTAFGGKPYSGLKRAEEFIDVGKHENALEVLFDVLRNKRHRDKLSEHILVIKKFCELCANHKRTTLAKDGLYQYKLICKANPQAFCVAVENYLNLITANMAKIKEEVQEAKSAETEESNLSKIMPVMHVDDLDIVFTPEALLAQLSKGHDTRGSSERVSLIPHLRFMWDNLRNMLDLVKNNNAFEKLYHDIAKRGMDFCVEFKRKAEFRKLCETIRTHLMVIQRYSDQNQETSVRLSNPASIQILMDTRTEIIDAAIKIDACLEAFRAIEESHHLISLAKAAEAPHKPSVLVSYFKKQAKVYWMARNFIFHAASLQLVFSTLKDDRKNHKKQLEDIKRSATLAVLSSLAVPVFPCTKWNYRFVESQETVLDSHKQLASYLYLPSPPTRQALINDIKNFSMFVYLPTEVQQVYNLLEVEFNPLLVCNKLCPLFVWLENDEEFKTYLPQLKQVCIVRIVKELAQVYESISFKRLFEIIPFLEDNSFEKYIFYCSQCLDIELRISHKDQCILFSSDLSFEYYNSTPEGPCIQPRPVEIVSSQLAQLHSSMANTVTNLKKQEIIQACQTLENHNILYFQRFESKLPIIFEKRRRDQEKTNNEQDIRLTNLKFKIKSESSKNETQALTKQKIEGTATTIAANMAATNEQGTNDMMNISGAEYKKSELLAQQEKAKQESERIKILREEEKHREYIANKYKQLEKNLDHYTRAVRAKEHDLIVQYEEERIKLIEEEWNRREHERISNAKKDHQQALELRERLSRMVVHSEKFVNDAMIQRKEEYDELYLQFHNDLKLYNDAIAAIRLEKKEARNEKRKEEYIKVAKYQRNLRKQQEKENEENEKVEKMKEHLETEKMKKLNQQEQLQRAKNLEIEKKMEAQQAAKVLPNILNKFEDEKRRSETKFESQHGNNSSSNTRVNNEKAGIYVPPNKRDNRSDVTYRNTRLDNDRSSTRYRGRGYANSGRGGHKQQNSSNQSQAYNDPNEWQQVRKRQ